MFLASPHVEDREFRRAELGARCFVARGLMQDFKTVIGIATEQYIPGMGFSLDGFYFFKENWTSEDKKEMQMLQKKCGYFNEPIQTQIQQDEFPKWDKFIFYLKL